MYGDVILASPHGRIQHTVHAFDRFWDVNFNHRNEIRSRNVYLIIPKNKNKNHEKAPFILFPGFEGRASNTSPSRLLATVNPVRRRT